MITHQYIPLYRSSNGPTPGPIIIFRDTTLIELKANFQKWCEIGLGEVGASRQLEASVIKHMQTEFVGLINAV